MRWEGGRRSDNVEDRRGGGFGGGLPRIGGRGLGLGGLLIAVVVGMLFGINPLTMLGMLGGVPTDAAVEQPAQRPPADDAAAAFVSTILASTEEVWGEQFRRAGGEYQPPTLVLFRGATRTACGMGQAAMGPFYCPADAKVYIDLGFFDTLERELGAPGDFAQAYVIAHEVGHHIQNITGVLQRSQQGSGPESDAVRVELQADCYAGVWAYYADELNLLEPGDIEEALNAAARIGDDHLQQQSRGVVVPESFTHGTSAQRARWFRRGYETGNPDQCDTFSVRQL